MKKLSIINIFFMTILMTSSNIFTGTVYLKYLATEKDPALYAQIDSGATDGWTEIKKLDEKKTYKKQELKDLSSGSGNRFIYFRTKDGFYMTQTAYLYPEIVTIKHNNNKLTYIVQNTTEAATGIMPKSYDAKKISEKEFNQNIKFSTEVSKKRLENLQKRVDSDIKNVEKIFKSDSDPLTTLNNMLKAQKTVIEDKEKLGIKKEEIDLERKLLNAIDEKFKKIKKELEKPEKKEQKEKTKLEKDLEEFEKKEKQGAVYVLGIDSKDTVKQKRSKWIKLSEEFHPDKYQDVKEKEIADKITAIINDAYDKIK